MQRVEHGNFEANTSFLKGLDIDFSGKRILEIGCGKGSMTNYLFSKGAKVTGIDLSNKHLTDARKRFKNLPKDTFLKMSAQNLSFSSETFDYVLSFDVIEHLYDVEGHFLEVSRVLKKGGRYLFQTPNKYTNLIFSIVRDKSLTAWRNYHPSLQTKGSINKILSNSGLVPTFKNVDVYTEFFRNKLPRFLRWINPQKFGIHTNIYVVALKPKSV